MKKARFPRVALEHFRKIDPEKIRLEIETSTLQLNNIVPKNHREELSLASNWKRVAVLKLILEHQHSPDLESLLGSIAVIVDI